MTVVVLGDVNVDLELMLPEPGELEHLNPDPVMSGGGSAANTAAALARLGVATRFVGAVGRDAFGEAAVESLRECGVDVSGVVSADGSTVAVLVVVSPDGERLIYVWPPRGGAHLELDEETVRAGTMDPTWVHVSGIALRGEPAATSLIGFMERARSVGIRVSLDLNLRLENWGWESGFREVIEAAVSAADVVFGGLDDEVLPMTGARDVEMGLRQLAGRDRIVVGRRGDRGAVAFDGAQIIASDGFAVEAVDTVGAGDAFNAGFIAARLTGSDLQRSLAHANAVAALTVSRRGARDTPTPAEVEELMSQSSVVSPQSSAREG